MLRVLDLFSGLGGFSLGLERTGGYETVAFCEIDKHCQKVLQKHWNSVPIFEDVSQLRFKGKYIYYNEPKKIPIQNVYKNDGVEVVCGGYPCTGHSTAGKKRGLKDEKSGLWKEFKRIIQESKPRWVVIENSANMRSNGLTEVLQDLWQVGFRDIRWDVLSAEAYGCIHKRERIYIIANSHEIRLREATFASTEEESKRRAEAWLTFSNRECPEPSFCGVDDEIPKELERVRKRQVGQYGNSLIPDIPERIGKYILELEKGS